MFLSSFFAEFFRSSARRFLPSRCLLLLILFHSVLFFSFLTSFPSLTHPSKASHSGSFLPQRIKKLGLLFINKDKTWLVVLWVAADEAKLQVIVTWPPGSGSITIAICSDAHTCPSALSHLMMPPKGWRTPHPPPPHPPSFNYFCTPSPPHPPHPGCDLLSKNRKLYNCKINNKVEQYTKIGNIDI